MGAGRWWLAAGALLAVSACQTGPTPAEFKALQQKVDSLSTLLAATETASRTGYGSMVRWLKKDATPKKEGDLSVHAWHELVKDAICNLEETVKPPAGRRLCEAGSDHGTPPPPPPWLQ